MILNNLALVLPLGFSQILNDKGKTERKKEK